MSPDQPDCSAPLPLAALHGLELFNEGDYFEAHEFLESAWRAEPGPNRGLYQAILQAAVTYLHIQRGNYMGAVKVAARARVKLDQWPAACCGVDVETLRSDLARVIEALTRLGPQHIRDFDQSLFKPVKYER
jgi:predicted metal-dependent hydrolase